MLLQRRQRLTRIGPEDLSEAVDQALLGLEYGTYAHDADPPHATGERPDSSRDLDPML